MLDRLGVFDELATERHVFDHTPEAIAHARVHAKHIEHGPGPCDPIGRGLDRHTYRLTPRHALNGLHDPPPGGHDDPQRR